MARHDTQHHTPDRPLHDPPAINRRLQPNLRIFILRHMLILIRQQHSLINCNRQSPVPASNHDCTQDQLAKLMPRAAEAIFLIRQADADADTAVPGHDLEDDVEDAEHGRVGLELRALDHHDQEDGKREPPGVVRQLRAELLPHEVGFGLLEWPPLHLVA